VAGEPSGGVAQLAVGDRAAVVDERDRVRSLLCVVVQKLRDGPDQVRAQHRASLTSFRFERHQ
jgi:hypothetical protein